MLFENANPSFSSSRLTRLVDARPEAGPMFIVFGRTVDVFLEFAVYRVPLAMVLMCLSS
jgi:hypothetical protein